MRAPSTRAVFLRKVLVSLLLVVAPFTGVRLVCIERPAGVLAVAGGEAAAHCGEFCPRPPSRVHDSGTSNMECLFSTDSTVFMVVAGTAVLPLAPSVGSEIVSLPVEAEPRDSYLAPFLAPHSPPPKT